MAPTRPLSLKKSNGSELSNAAAISPFRNITWPTNVCIHDKTLKGGKIHRYNDMRDFAKTQISPTSQNRLKYLSSFLHKSVSFGWHSAFHKMVI